MPSPLDVSKRALVALLRSLGLAFGCPVTVTRDSSEQQVKGAFRSVALGERCRRLALLKGERLRT